MGQPRQIPGLAEAFRAEASARRAPFVGASVVLCGVEVRPLSLRDHERLADARSPFLHGGIPDRGDIALLLWNQRWEIDGDDKATFAARLDALDLGEMSAAVGAWVSRALMDAPQGSGKAAPVVSLAASLVHCLRKAYPGMSRDDVMDMDVAELFQYVRLIQRDANPQAVFFNPLSDGVKGRWLRELNQPKPKPQRKRAKGKR